MVYSFFTSKSILVVSAIPVTATTPSFSYDFFHGPCGTTA